MNQYSFHLDLKQLYVHALEQYQKGSRDVGEFFTEEQKQRLASLGAKPMDLYDYVEDYVRQGEPDWETLLAVQTVRRQYFLLEQLGKWTSEELNPETLPAKTDELDGIPWLPRIIEKAKGKLKGQLPSSVMYGCSGDRRFLRSQDIHPADFLQAVWFYRGDEQKILQWIKGRGNQT
jgi:hypothetical protein